MGKFVYPTLPKFFGMLRVCPKRIGVEVRPKRGGKEFDCNKGDIVMASLLKVSFNMEGLYNCL